MAINPSDNSSTKPVEITIRAKDEAKEVIRGTEVAFAKLRAETSAVSKTLTVASDSFVTVARFADTARLKVLNVSTAMAGLGVATVTSVGLITSKITGLFGVFGEIKRTVQENPVATNFFSMIGKQAEEAISQTASLSDSIRAIATVAVPFGEGFTREILKLDTKPISQKISESVSLGVRGITDSVFKPIEEALGFSIFSGVQKAIGTSLVSLDKNLAKNAITSFFDTTLGVGPVRALVEDIVTSPAIAQYSPKFIQALLGGSASAAVDELTGSVGELIKTQIPQNSPLASLIIGTGFNGQIQSLAGTEVQTVFQGLNAQLADFTLENRIINLIGNKTSASFVKGILKQPLITNILAPTVQALATGNFTEAIALSLETNLSRVINSAFESANKKVAELSSAAGRATLSRILDGGAKRKAEERLKELKDSVAEEKDILDARKAIIEDNFRLDERTLTDKISSQQNRLQTFSGDDTEKQELERNITLLTSQLTRLRVQQGRELSNLQREYNIYESKARSINGEISELEKYLARSNRAESVIGDTFSGVGERFLKGFGFGSKISLTNKILPAIFDLSTGNITGILSNYIGSGLSDALDKIFPEINAIASDFAAKITRIKPLDDVLGKGVAIAGGKAIDALIPKLLSPVVDGTIDTLLDGLQQGGGRDTAQAINRYLPGYLQNVGNLIIDGVRGTGSKVISNQLAKFFPPLIQGAIADGIQSTGISKVIFTKIFENLNPKILRANLLSLSDGLGNLSSNIVSSLSKIEVFAIKALYGVQRAIVSVVGSVSYIQEGISKFALNTNAVLDKLSEKVVAFYGVIVNATNQGAVGATNLLTKATQLLEKFKGGETAGTKVAIIESFQNGIAKAVQAVGFLQSKILSLADSGLDLSFAGIENFRDFIGKVDTFSKNIIPNIKNGISIAFDLAIAGVDKLNSFALKTLSFAVAGIENIKKLSPQVIDFLIKGVSGLQGAIAGILSGIDSILEKIISAGKLDVGAFDFLSQARINLQGLGASIDQELVATRQNLRLSKLRNIISDVLVNGMKEGGVKDLAKTVNSILPSSLQTIGNLFIDGIRGTGSKFTANILSAFFPKSSRAIISRQLQETGISSKLFDGVFETIKTTNITDVLRFIDKQIEDIKPIIKPLLDGFNEKLSVAKTQLNSFVKEVQGFFSAAFLSVVSKIQSFVSTSIGSINNLLTLAENKIIGLVNAISSATRDIGKTLTDSLTRVSDLIKGLKTGQSGFKLAFLEVFQTGIDKAIAAVGFLQQKIRTLANNGLNSALNAIDKIRESLNAIAETSDNIIPILQGLFTKLTKSVQDAFGFIRKTAINAWNAFPENLARVLVVLRKQIDGARNIIASLFSSIDGVLGKIIDSGKISVSAFDFLSGAKNKISGFAAALRQQQQDTKNSAEETKQRFLDLATNIQKSLVNAGGSVTKFADNIKKTLGKAKEDAANGIDTGIPTQIIRLYDGIGEAISGIVRNGLFDPEVIQNRINSIQDAIKNAIPVIDAFGEALSEKGQEIRDNLNKVFGDSAERFGNFISNLFDEDTTDATAIKFRTLLSPFQDIFKDLFKLTSQQGKRSFLAGILGEGFDRIAPALDLVDRSIVKIYQSISSVARQTSFALDVFSLIPGKFAGFNEPLAVFGYFETLVGSVAGGISFVSEKLSFFTQGLASLQELTQNGPFRLLIGQTVELREQLLATQASLVGTSKILNSLTGEEIADPVKAIQSLDLPIKNQIELLRKESLKLVGVTSKDLVPLFQQVAQKITSVGGSLSDARALSLDFAASLGTLNIPLFQSQQEISSILSAQIDQNSALAKNLNISSDQVNNWKAQGKLVEELRKRLEAFRQGNEIASETFGGFTSNIQEVFDEIGRAAGQRLIDPLVDQLGEVYKFLERNQEQLVAYFEQFSDYMLRIGSAITISVKVIAKSFQGLIAQAPIYLFKSLTNVVEAFSNAIQFTAQVLAPVVNTLSAMLSVAGALGGPMLGLFITTKALSSGVGVLGDMFGVVTQLIPGLGELLFFLDVRSEGVLNQFVNLSKILGVGAGGFLVLGKNLEAIPGALGVIEQALGPVGGLVAGFIPTIAGVGIQVAGLIAIFPPIGAFLSNLVTQSPKIATALAGLAAGSIYTAPLASLFTQAATGLELYADASTRQAIIGKQLTEVLRSIGKAAASNIITLGYLAGGAYAAFLIFDNFVLKNETVKQVLSLFGDGVKAVGEILADVFGNEMVRGISIATALSAIISLGLIPSIRTLIALQLGTWATAAANGLNGLSKAAALFGLTNFAATLLSSSVALKTIGVLFTSGTAAAVRFAAQNGLVITTFKFLPPATAKGTAGLAVFTKALWKAIAPMLPLIGTVAAAAAAIAAFGLILRSQQLADSSEAVEIYRQQLEATGNQSIKLAQKLKQAGDIQKEANEKGVRLSDEQYKANQRLLNQSKNQIILLQEQLKARQAALAETKGDGNKAALEQQIKDLERQIALLQNLSGDAIQIAPKDLKDKGSAFEQLEKKIQGAKDALASPSGDEEVFKNKANELIDFTQKQLELGNITAEEARRNLALVANNTKVDQETRTKAQQAITESFKNESAERVDILKAEFDLINAQLAAGQLDFAKNAEEIANLQNSVLEERQQEEQKAHQATLKRIEEEYQARKFVLEQEAITLRNKAKEKPGTQESKDAIARAEQINKELVELEQKKNQDLTNQTKNNAATNQAIAKQITQNKATQAKLGAELEKQVRSGAISEEEAALRQSSAVKKAELDTQLASTKAAYENSRAAIALQFQQDIDKLDKELQEAQSKADKLPENTKEFQQAQNEIVSLQTKYAGLRDARETALGKADREFEAESKKLNAQALQNQADTQKKQRDAAIKFLDSRQKEAQDILQKSQNAQLINLQKLENEGINIRAESEFEKTKLSRDQINEQLRQEQERLKKLQSLPKPENQEEQIQLDAQIRASRLKTQELIRQGLENEAKAYESQIQAVRDRIQIENTLSETNLQRQYLKGKALRSRIEVESAESKVRELETALTLEIKNIEKRAALEAELEQARTGLADARVAATRDRIQVENTIIETGLQRQYRTGQILRSKAEIETARGKVREIQAALKIETRRTKERVALEAELEQALTALLDAEIRERQELIDTQNQEYLNQIEEQNQAIKQQSVLYEVLASALEIRNKLLEATKNLTQAAAGFVVSELDALSKLESSEYRRKQIAEITAAVKLEALRKQQEFERESLEIQIQQNKLALEREAIQNRINQAAKIGEIAKEVAEIESLKADPRNNNRAGQAQIRARELAVQAKQFELVQLGVQGELIGSQLNNQETLANFQRRSQELSQKGQERQAQVELINSLPAGRRQRAQRASRQRILEESFGFSDSREFRNAGLSLSRDIVQRETGIVPTVDVLSGIDPELGGLLENLSGAQGQSAIADVRKTFGSKFGGTASFSGIESADPTGKPLQLLPEFQGRLTLPSPGDRGAVLGLEKTGSLFNMGVDKLIKFLDGKDGVKGGTINYNINVSAPTGTAKASGNGTTPSLENVLRLAKQTAGIR